MLRMQGDLVPIKFRDLGDAELEAYITEVLTQSQLKVLREGNDLDFSYVSTEGGRFRVNVFRKETGIGAAFRAIPTAIPSMDQLKLPPIVRKLCDYHQGMILVTGSTGTGKTTTLASMIDYLNSTRSLNIISLEDPIEFVHRSKTSQVIQRELGTHLPTFAEGVRAAMREDPDVILVGELRDLETMSIAVTAAEMGILVMATLHTNGAAATVDRLVNAFPADKQPHVRTMLSTSLRGVVSQQLIPKADKTGRVAALEILINTPAVANLIRQGKMDQLENAMQSGAATGMRLMDTAIQSLLESKQISGKEAFKKSINKAKFEQFREAS
jgi:twitching motility protein PilT